MTGSLNVLPFNWYHATVIVRLKFLDFQAEDLEGIFDPLCFNFYLFYETIKPKGSALDFFDILRLLRLPILRPERGAT